MNSPIGDENRYVPSSTYPVFLIERMNSPIGDENGSVELVTKELMEN